VEVEGEGGGWVRQLCCGANAGGGMGILTGL